MTNIKIGASKTILKSNLFEVKQTKVTYPSGKRFTYQDVYRQDAVYVFPLTKSYDIYLIYQYRYLHDLVMLESVAGHIEKKEKATQAALRELEEETGIRANQIEEFARVEEAGSVVKQKLHFFLAKDLEFGPPQTEADEDITVKKFTLNRAVELVLSGKIVNAPTCMGILFLSEMRRQKKI